MPATIPEATVWIMLQAMHKTAGPQSPRILTAAGLGRFLTTPPARHSFRPAATHEEVMALFREIYAMLGEDLTRLFHRNHGEITADEMRQLPWAAQMRADAQAVPPAEQVRRFAETFAAGSASTSAPYIVTEDATAAYLAADPCIVCVGITGVKRPLCAGGEVIIGRTARYCLDRRVRVVEVECAAMGASHCKYALYK